SDVKASLSRRLPGYMIPAQFVLMSQLPLTVNGKIDKKQLPSPSGGVIEGEYIPPATETEQVLAGIWSSLLKIEESQVSARANFFALGGHSLLAIRLISQVQLEFDVKLHVIDIFQHQELKELAAQIDTYHILGGSQLKETENGLLILKEGASDLAPLFIVHPVGGLAHCYALLTYMLTYRGAVYGLQSNKMQFASIETMANHYIESIQAIHPADEYVISGWSMGGAVAYEIANQLKGSLNKVSQLILFDSFNPDIVRKLSNTDEAFARIDSLVTLASELGIDLTAYEGASMEQYMAMTDQQLMQTLLNALNKQTPNEKHLSVTELKLRFKMLRNNSLLLSKYHPQPSNIQINLIRASENEYEIFDLGWRELTDSVSVSESDGDHFSIFKMPNVARLASLLDKILE
uniref:thioesterase domain-containing protein n=1 Tax=Paraglaciecola sp. TaxID=1920173 RepID=UPI0030F3C241